MTTMFTVKLGYDGISAEELVERGRAHVLALTGNPTFPASVPPLADITAACNALEAANIAVTNNGGKQDHLVRRERESDLKELIKELAGYVQAASGGDPEKIATAAFTTRKLPDPPEPMSAPGNLRVVFTDKPGELKARWNAVKDKRIYQVSICDGDPLVEANWKLLVMTSQNNHLATGLTSHRDYSFRVNAVGALGVGPFSDIATTKPL